MLQDQATDNEGAPAPPPTRSRATEAEAKRASRLRRSLAEGHRISDAHQRWLDAYSQRSPEAAANARRRAQGKVDIAAVIATVAAVYRIKPTPLNWTRRGSVTETEPRRTLVWALRELGATKQEIRRVTGLPDGGAASRMARNTTRFAAADPDVAARMAKIMAGLRRGRPVTWADGVIEATRVVEPGRETITLVVEVGSSLWQFLDRWAEAYEIGYLAHDTRERPDSLAAEGARE